MKQRKIRLLTIALLAVCLIASCQMGEVPDKTADARFVIYTVSGRGLNRTEPSFDAGKLYWKYEALKADDSGLSTGQTVNPVAVNPDGGAGLSGKVGPFSLGLWDFTLYGYTDAGYKNLAYKGSAADVEIKKMDKGSTNTVSVKVKTEQNATGTISILDAITLHDSEGHPVDQYERVITLTYLGADEGTQKPVAETTETGYTQYTVTSGPWKVNVVYRSTTDPSIEYGNNTIFVNVFDYQTTYVRGSLDEITSDAQFETTADGGVKPPAVTATVESGASTVISVNSTPAVQTPAKPEEPVDTEKTTITVPEGVLTGTKAKVALVTYSAETSSEKFTFTSDDGAAVVGGLDITLHVDDTAVTEFSKDVTVETYIEPNLKDVKVYYNGGSEKTEYASTYVAETGKLTFTTNHFSEYYIMGSFIPDTSWFDPNAPKSAYTLSTPRELYGLAVLVNAGNSFQGITITLDSDIDLRNDEWTPIGTTDRSGNDTNYFCGHFDGRNHSISNLKISGIDRKNSVVGLFGAVKCGTIENIILESGSVHAPVDTSAGIVGATIGGGPGDTVIIRNCVNKATITGAGSGAHAGILGRAYGSADSVTIEDCINYGTVNGNDAGKSGGIVGINNSTIAQTTLIDCHNYAAVSDKYAGGIIGLQNNNIRIESCTNHAGAEINGAAGAGGIAGHIQASNNDTNYHIVTCLNEALIKGNKNAGGILGGTGGTECFYLYECINRGNINSQENAGGILGSATGNCVITRCINTAAVSATSFAGGIGGCFKGTGSVFDMCSGGKAEITVTDPTSDRRGRLVGSVDSGPDKENVFAIDDSNGDDYTELRTAGSLAPDTMYPNWRISEGTFRGIPKVGDRYGAGMEIVAHLRFNPGTSWDRMDGNEVLHFTVPKYFQINYLGNISERNSNEGTLLIKGTGAPAGVDYEFRITGNGLEKDYIIPAGTEELSIVLSAGEYDLVSFRASIDGHQVSDELENNYNRFSISQSEQTRKTVDVLGPKAIVKVGIPSSELELSEFGPGYNVQAGTGDDDMSRGDYAVEGANCIFYVPYDILENPVLRIEKTDDDFNPTFRFEKNNFVVTEEQIMDLGILTDIEWVELPPSEPLP